MAATISSGRTVSVYVFRRPQSGCVEFLTLRRATGLALAGSWQSVHGGVEQGESSQQAALRELREETGLEPIAFYLVNEVELLFDPDADEFSLVPVFAAEVDGRQRVVISAEHDSSEWCTPEAAAERFIWPTQRTAIASIVRDIATPRQVSPWLRLGDGTGKA